MRKLILPFKVCFLLTGFMGVLGFVELALAYDQKSEVKVWSGQCVASGVEMKDNNLRLNLTCGKDKRQAFTTQSYPVYLYAKNQTATFNCKLNRYGNATCEALRLR